MSARKELLGHLRRLLGEGRKLADASFDAWRAWQGRLDLPLRHCHADLKISNLRFSEAGEGICLLDLDTLALQPIDVELGDAWRSWRNPVGEDATEARFDLEVFAAAVAGYREVRPFGAEEREALADAVERIALGLAARFYRQLVVQGRGGARRVTRWCRAGTSNAPLAWRLVGPGAWRPYGIQML